VVLFINGGDKMTNIEHKVGDRVRCVYPGDWYGSTATVISVANYTGLTVSWHGDKNYCKHWSLHSSFEPYGDPNACPQCGEIHP
jgi:hypothetical protein